MEVRRRAERGARAGCVQNPRPNFQRCASVEGHDLEGDRYTLVDGEPGRLVSPWCPEARVRAHVTAGAAGAETDAVDHAHLVPEVVFDLQRATAPGRRPDQGVEVLSLCEKRDGNQQERRN